MFKHITFCRLAFVMLHLFCTLFCTNSLFAQINKGGQPLSFDAKVGLPALKTVPTYTSAALDMAAINAENAIEDEKGTHYIGKLMPAHQTLLNSGVWTEQPNGDRVWRLKIVAENALAITLYYDDFYLPKGGKMFVFTADKKETYGAFTEENNNTHRLFVTAMTHTDECILEYYEPVAVRGEGIIHIGQVAHAYRDVKSRAANAAATPLASGACNVDVNCPEGATWQDQKHATVTLLTTANANQAFCSGAMINNTRQDCTPYVLTANHCISGTTAAGYAQMAFYFNHEHAVCGGTVESVNQIVAGAIFCAAAGGNGVQKSDFALLQVKSAIPTAANAYFSGWDANDVAAPSGVSIHHPAGDVKKISTYTTPLISTNYSNPAAGVTHWHVNWVQTATNYGITEGGSSGSPLFNSDHRIVGDLSGGPSSCTATDKSDYYGKFSYSWTSCGTTPDLQLKPWLDPDNTGLMTMDGTYSPCSGFLMAIAASAKSLCAGASDSTNVPITINGTGAPVTLSATAPAGITASVSPSNFTATGTAHLVFAVAANTVAGTYNVVVSGTDGSSTQTKTVVLTVTNGVPMAAVLTMPLDAAVGIGYTPTLTCTSITGATSYTTEVATDAAFISIIATGTLATNTYTVNPTLIANTTYYWRTKATNGCGSGTFSNVFSFKTGIIQCFTSANTSPTNLVDNGTTNATMAVGANGSVAGVRVIGLRGTHTYTSDLAFTLISPQGTRVSLLAGLCGSNNDFDLSLDDAATIATIPCPLTGAGTYKPASPLAAFNGENAQGNWTMEVIDDTASDTGILQNWGLDLCLVGNGTLCILSANMSVSTACIGATVTATPANTSGTTVTYLWDTGETTASVANITVGTHTVTVTDGACSATNTVLVVNPSIAISGVLTSCGASTLTATGGTTYTWSGGTATGITGQRRFGTSGTYTVTVTGTGGCTATSTMAVVINTIPNATVAGALTACGSVNLAITPVTGASYAWSGGATPTTATNTFVTSGIYTLTVTAANGCSRTGTRTITVNPLPTTATITTDQTIATPPNGAMQVTATAGRSPYTYAILTGAPNTTGIFAGLAAGNYTVTVTDAAACSTTRTVNIAFNVATENLSKTLRSLQLAPNPTQGQFTVSLNLAEAQNTTLDIIDIMGRILQTQTNMNNTASIFAIDLSDAAADLYFVRLRIGQEVVMLKVNVMR